MVSVYFISTLFILGVIRVVGDDEIRAVQMITVGIAIVLSGVSFLYVRLRKISPGKMVGLGDVLFLFTASLFFPPQMFLVFLILSCFLGLGYCLLLGEKKIPMIAVSSGIWISFKVWELISYGGFFSG